MAQPLECVACLLVVDGRVLVEKRSLTKKLAPGLLAIPGGHVEAGEDLQDAVWREALEEFGIVVGEMRYVCTLLHQAEEFRRIHYYALLGWEGAITNHEAESLLWLPLDELERLDFDIDRIAVAELGRAAGFSRDAPGGGGRG